MEKPVPKTSALIVSAIRKLREIQGSTSKEIINFIRSEYDVPQPTVKRKLQAALKRGVEYGILKRQQGHYFLSTDASGGSKSVTEKGGSIEKCGKKRKYRKCKKTRRCARGCVPRRRKKGCGRKRRHSRRKRCCGRRRNTDVDTLALSPLDCEIDNEINAQRSHNSRRGTRSPNHSPSRSRSSHSSAEKEAE